MHNLYVEIAFCRIHECAVIPTLLASKRESRLFIDQLMTEQLDQVLPWNALSD